MTSPFPPRLARALYRAMLRASQGGRNPEVFGTAGAQAFLSQATDEHTALAIPATDRQVRLRLKAHFQQRQQQQKRSHLNGNRTTNQEHFQSAVDGQSSFAPLQVLRQVQQDSVADHLEDDASSKMVLPIFDYGGVAALPGETLSFCFVEPRYLKLGVTVWQTQRRQFLLRHSSESNTASLLQLQSHLVLPNDMVAVTCRAGPRVFVRATRDEHVDGQVHPIHAHTYNLHAASPILTSATSYCVCPDKDHLEAKIEFAETRQYILHLLHCILPYQDSELDHTLLAFGLPPLYPEAFSYWVLRHILAVNDVTGRLEWLHGCNSTTRRLDFLVRELEEILDYQKEQAA